MPTRTVAARYCVGTPIGRASGAPSAEDHEMPLRSTPLRSLTPTSIASPSLYNDECDAGVHEQCAAVPEDSTNSPYQGRTLRVRTDAFGGCANTFEYRAWSAIQQRERTQCFQRGLLINGLRPLAPPSALAAVATQRRPSLSSGALSSTCAESEFEHGSDAHSQPPRSIHSTTTVPMVRSVSLRSFTPLGRPRPAKVLPDTPYCKTTVSVAPAVHAKHCTCYDCQASDAAISPMLRFRQHIQERAWSLDLLRKRCTALERLLEQKEVAAHGTTTSAQTQKDPPCSRVPSTKQHAGVEGAPSVLSLEEVEAHMAMLETENQRHERRYQSQKRTLGALYEDLTAQVKLVEAALRSKQSV